MNEEIANKTGSRSALLFVTIGLIIAYSIMAIPTALEEGFIRALSWVVKFDFTLNVLVAVIAMYVFGYVFGKLAGNEIIIKRKNFVWVGIKYTFVTFVLSIFVAGFVGFFKAMENSGDIGDLWKDYIFKPVFLISLFGFIPVIIIGVLFGYHIKYRGKA